MPGPGLPDNIIKLVKPVYDRLSNEKLLRKYLDGKTQNQNESFNGIMISDSKECICCMVQVFCNWGYMML